MGSRAEKEQIVEELRDKLSRAQSVILTDYRGLNVAESNQLRRQLRTSGVEFRVVKNTMTWRAAQALGLEELEEILKGPTALAFGYEDPVAPARELSRFARDHQQVKLKGGVMDGRILTLEEVKALAALPGREELLAKVAGSFAAPLSGMAFALSGLLRNFAYAVDALRRQKEAEA